MYLLSAPRIAGYLPAPKPPIDFRDLIQNLLPDEGFWVSVFTGLDGAVAADELIERHIRKHPDKAPVLWDCFMTLRPHIPIFNPTVQKRHARELLDRAVRGGDLKRPTTVEAAYYALALLMTEHDLDEYPPIEAVLNWLNIQPPFRIKQIVDQMNPVADRHIPDPQRWHDRVPLHRKQQILGDTEGPAGILTRATWERDKEDTYIMKSAS